MTKEHENIVDRIMKEVSHCIRYKGKQPSVLVIGPTESDELKTWIYACGVQDNLSVEGGTFMGMRIISAKTDQVGVYI